MSPRVPTFDLTIDYQEEDKGVIHDINVQITPKHPKPPIVRTVKRRRRIVRKMFTGRYVKRTGGFASKVYAKRHPKKVRRVYRTVIRYPVRNVMVEEAQSWTDDDAFKAFWAAHKIVQKRGNVETDLKEWTIKAINWRKGGNLYEYPTAKVGVTETIAAMGGILEDETTTIRVGLIER